ncbi:hypothetical protein E2R66_04700 [Mucilaginibacter psychrotolerans]|uniref:Uncharacterized protein n=1 Tax=Mucilaginibacter psychrotolerans TaxID=1524096 RepID=A0A4Y8SNG3_9SPHI|nr:hypothetical protein E2R66_04700 [Mucilaginibacter psychrotolerans]
MLPKITYLTLLFLFTAIAYCSAQTDTLYLNNQKLACSVKEITPDAVKYTYPGEDLINTVYKNTIQKIVFKSGRVQVFAEATSYKALAGVMDYDKVTVTSVEGEVRGLYKLGEVNSKAKGTTVFSNQERVKERAFKKLKIMAAIFGGNIVYLANQRTEGNKFGGEYGGSSTAETNLTGIAYSNILPDFDAFQKAIGTKKDFVTTMQYKLWASDTDVSQDVVNKTFQIFSITNENGIVYIEAQLQGEKNITKFQLAYFTGDSFSIAYKNKGTAYNYQIKI